MTFTYVYLIQTKKTNTHRTKGPVEHNCIRQRRLRNVIIALNKHGIDRRGERLGSTRHGLIKSNTFGRSGDGDDNNFRNMAGNHQDVTNHNDYGDDDKDDDVDHDQNDIMMLMFSTQNRTVTCTYMILNI